MMRNFFVIWGGQLVSLFGSALTGFALGVWIYQQTGSVTQFSLLYVMLRLPGAILSPFAGTLIDRWDRRRVMLWSDTGAALSSMVILGLLLSGRLELWHVYLATGVGSICSAFQWPAWSASVTLLVPKEKLGQANGLVSMAESLAQVVAPLAGGLLLPVLGIRAIIGLDFLSFLIGIGTLLAVRIPRPEISVGKVGSILGETLYGLRWLASQAGLMALLLFSVAVNFTLGIVEVLFTPLVLSFASPTALGTILSLGGTGLLLGSIAMSVWGGPKRRVNGILGFTVIQGVLLFVAGLQPNLVLITVASFVYFFCYPLITSCIRALWQVKVAPDLQGRIFSVRGMSIWFSMAMAYLVAGASADRVFEPLLMPGGALADSLGPILGVGPGRGIALMILLQGFFVLGVVLIAFLMPRLRRLDTDLPDAIPATPPTEAMPAGVS